MSTPVIDWNALHTAAMAVARNAYCPYSRLHVGAAGLVDDGRIVVGCNVENASHGVGLCAECGMVSALRASGGGRLVAVIAVNGGTGDVLAPCGRCRQVLLEHGGPELWIRSTKGDFRMGDYLPDFFGPADLPT